MTIPIISSTSNAQVKQLIQLQKKAKLRAEQDVFIIEGIKMSGKAAQLIHTYASESFYNKKRELFDGKEKNLTIFTNRVFESISDTKSPQGFCVWCGRISLFLAGSPGRTGGKRTDHGAVQTFQDPGNFKNDPADSAEGVSKPVS